MVDPQRVEQERSVARRASILGMPYIDVSLIAEKLLYKTLLSVPEIKAYKVVPLTVDRNHVKFGITTTTSQKTMQMLVNRFLDQQVTFSIISDAGFNDYLLLYDPPKKIEYKDIAITKQSDAQSITSMSATLQQVRADDMLAFLVQQAFRLQASDIHLESRLDGARIRLRVHGVLHSIATLDSGKYRQLMGVLASAANISMSAEDDQTGHINRDFKMATGEMVNVNLRVETVPAVNGIDAVLRLFNFSKDMMRLEKLGLSERDSSVVKDIISHPSGLVLIVGPTGSGKTTTLYSILNELNTDEHKIITLEDPVEYQIEGITQIPVKSREGQSFAEKFRAILRLDPDIIMVGEIRDLDTAKTALQAALTGHLVLSTYHASSAAAALTRLLDAIGENPLYASAIRLIQAQRLVRRLDPTTREQIQPSLELEKHLETVVGGIKADVDLGFLPDAKLFKAGSSVEHPFGFDGQFAIRELLTMSPEMQQLLTKPAHELSTDLIEEVAVKNGMLTMKQDGTLRALKGDTTYEEITRTVG
jgi:type II secretory ATPase GspE/PulE/Tfp pilus assembly ATPase PilB-like protein